MAARKFFRTKWICQQDVRECDGYFRLRGEDKKIKCPLAKKCRAAKSNTGYLEYRYARETALCRVSWWLREERVTEAEAKARVSERMALERLFNGDVVRAKARKWETENREHMRALRRGYAIHRSWQDIDPDRVPLNAAKTKPPPCGGDCRNCPYDQCKYPDWNDGLEEKRAKQREYVRQYHIRKKARMAADPEYAAAEKAKRKVYTDRYRARKRAYIAERGF